ncbi:hypothetical protein U1Q18_049936 [Sarracenia purpurea var. burkii]
MAKPRNWAALLNPSRSVINLTYIDPADVESDGLPAICEQCKSFGHETTKCKPVQQEVKHQTWTTVNKGKGVNQFVPRSVQFSDIPSSSMDPREESIDIPISGREETTEPVRKEIAAARPPISGNHFAPLYEDTDIQVEKEFEDPESDLADIENTMADLETE